MRVVKQVAGKAVMIWVQGHRVPEPRILFGHHKTKPALTPVLARFEIADIHAELPLQDLVKLYPCPTTKL